MSTKKQHTTNPDGELCDDLFDRLIGTYTEPLFRYVRRLVVVREDAEDIVQESFVKAFDARRSFHGGEQELRAWLYRIATNTALSLLRRRRRWFFLPQAGSDRTLRELAADAAGPDADQTLLRFQQAVLALPEKQRVVFNLRYYEEMEYEQIAAVTGSSVGSLKTNYHYAVRKIKERLTQ